MASRPAGGLSRGVRVRARVRVRANLPLTLTLTTSSRLEASMVKSSS